MLLTRFEALGLLPPTAQEFKLYTKLPAVRGNRVCLRFQLYKTLSMEGLQNWLDNFSPVNLVFLNSKKQPYLKFQDASYLKVDKLKMLKFIAENPTGYFEIS